jgi:hypothetical protein
MRPELTIVVPAFNEAHRLGDGMRRFDAAVADGAVDVKRTEVLVIDDGSTDQTASTARALLGHLPHHRVVSLPANQGKGAAVRTGVSLARGECTAYMDADMAIDPRAIPGLLRALETTEVAIGSRALPESMVDGTYAVRAVMGRLFNRMVTTGTGLDLHDTQCGFKAFRTPVARLLFHLVRIDRFAFDVEVLARARRLGLQVTEIPVHWKHVLGSDVYRSRLGLLPTPPVPGIVVRHPSDAGDAAQLAERAAAVVSTALAGVQVPVVVDGPSVTVLLPLVEPTDSAAATSAIRAEFAGLQVYRKDFTLEGLSALGPLAGRLGPHQATEGRP